MLNGGARREDGADELGENAYVRGVIAVGRVATLVVEVGDDREVGVALGLPHVDGNLLISSTARARAASEVSACHRMTTT